MANKKSNAPKKNAWAYTQKRFQFIEDAAQSPELAVRVFTAQNVNTPRTILQNLLDDDDLTVVRCALQNPNLSHSALMRYLENLPANQLEALEQDSDTKGFLSKLLAPATKEEAPEVVTETTAE